MKGLSSAQHKYRIEGFVSKIDNKHAKAIISSITPLRTEKRGGYEYQPLCQARFKANLIN
ncbi:hypothetical protein CXF72_07635 [Psychromonas sp. MB-3u-54]|nr:hypothetical protein CXF72_07635 [Psychromonas sp. MB-3u-54]